MDDLISFIVRDFAHWRIFALRQFWITL